MKKPKETGRPVRNKHRVSKFQWNKWSSRAKNTFNEMFYSLRDSMQFTFLHPCCPPMNKKYWATTRWNVAWNAAEVANGNGPLEGVIDVPNKKRKHRKPAKKK